MKVEFVIGKCIACLKDKPLTEEHIILKALGGGLKPYLLCKDCNSSFGATIDDAFLGFLPICLARNIENVAGRAVRIRAPFEGVEGALVLDGGKKVAIKGGRNLDAVMPLGPKVEILEEAVKVSAAFRPEVSKDFMLRSILKSVDDVLNNGCGLLADEVIRLKKCIEVTLAKTDGFELRKGREIDYSITLDLNLVSLAFEKMAYEIASYLYGENYFLKSNVAIGLRTDILNGESSADRCVLMPPPLPILEQIFSYARKAKKHVIVIMDGFVHIQVFSVSAMVMYENSSTGRMSSIRDDQIFLFDYKNETYEQKNFGEWLSVMQRKLPELENCVRALGDLSLRTRVFEKLRRDFGGK